MLGKYEGRKRKTDFYCTIHKEKFTSTPENVFNGTCCKGCYADRVRMRCALTQEEVEERVKNINKFIDVCGKYDSTSKKSFCKMQ